MRQYGEMFPPSLPSVPSPLRTEEEEEKDKRLYKKKARNFKKKYQILNSLKE